jgi:transposase
VPWKEVTIEWQRLESVTLAGVEEAKRRRFGISPKRGYKWLHSLEESGMDALHMPQGSDEML